jgi:hypothetical protein
LNLQAPGAVSSPNPAAEPPPTIRAPAAPARPQVRAASGQSRAAAPPPIPKAPASRPAQSNGSAPTPAPAEAEELPSWADVVTQNGIADPDTDTLPRTARKSSSSKRLKSLPPTAVPPRRLGWAIAIASAIVLAIVIVIVILSLLAGKKPNAETKHSNEPLVLHVRRLGSDGAWGSLGAALKQVRSRGGRVPAKIIVHDDLSESDVLIDVPNVTIEPEEGKKLIWKPPFKVDPKAKLLTVSRAEGFRIKGFTFDGEDKVETLINLFHHCPAMALEDLTLKRFNKYGVWVTNCEGDESIERHVLLTRLLFVSSKPDQTALFFSINERIKDTIPTNKFIVIRDCIFEGTGVKIKTPDPKNLDHVEFPAGLQPVIAP